MTAAPSPYLRQLLVGRDLAEDDPIARQMVNFVDLVGDLRTNECVAIDPAWDVRGLLRIVEEDGMRPTGAPTTHDHRRTNRA